MLKMGFVHFIFVCFFPTGLWRFKINFRENCRSNLFGDNLKYEISVTACLCLNKYEQGLSECKFYRSI